MQYNQYHATSHQVHPTSHSSQSPDDYPPSYPDPSHQHAALPYAAVTPATSLPAGSIAHQNITPQYYSPYATQGAPDAEHRSYYAHSPQGSAIEHYPATGSPTASYATPSPSSHVNSLHSPQPSSRHHTQLSHSQQPQFIPTPSQAYQVYSSAGPAPSARSRSAVEPYYHMSPNPQHAAHPHAVPMAHGVGGRNSAAPGTSTHSHHMQTGTHTGTIVVAAGERYVCNRCERTFTRSHDRRRHFETVHSTSPVLHKCRFCRKDFSRSDSLKRHVDNGCDEMPR